MDKALRLYQEAAELAESNGQPVRSLQLLHTAGAIAHREKRYREAVNLLRNAAIRYKTQEKAADAHLLAIVDAAQIARTHKTDDITVYKELLEEHIQYWPDLGPSTQVRKWHSRLLIQQQKWQAAFETLIQIDPTSTDFSSVVGEIEIETTAFHLFDAARQDSRVGEWKRLDRSLAAMSKRLDQETRNNATQQASYRIEILRVALELEATKGGPSVEQRLRAVTTEATQDEIRADAARCFALYYCNNQRFHDAARQIEGFLSCETGKLLRFVAHVFRSVPITLSATSKLRRQGADPHFS